MHFFLGNRKLVKADEESAATGLEGLADAVDGGMSSEGIKNSLLSTASQAAGQLIAKLENDISDANVFVCSDSTGNATNEWVYLYAQWLASEYPAFTVNYFLWDDTTADYEAASVIQSGTGTNTLNIYNGAISGTKITYLMGSKFDVAVRDIPSCDLVIINHGHNMINSYSQSLLASQKGSVPQYLESITKMLERHAGAGVLMLTQNPRRTDDQYQYIYNSIITTASLIGADVADSYAEFEALGRDISLYVTDDIIHPSSDGTQIYLNAIKAKHASSAAKSAKPAELTKNYLIGGDFKTLDGSNIPDGFAMSSEVSSVVDSSNYDNLNGYSLALTMDTSLSTAYIRKTLTSVELNALKGSWVTLSVKCLVAVGQSSQACRPYIDTNINDTDTVYTQTSDGFGDWVWRSVSAYIDPSVSYAFVGVRIDSSGTAGTVINVSDMVLSKGKLIGLQ